MADSTRGKYHMHLYGLAVTRPDHIAKLSIGDITPTDVFMIKEEVTEQPQKRRSIINIMILIPSLIYHCVRRLTN